MQVSEQYGKKGLSLKCGYIGRKTNEFPELSKYGVLASFKM